MNEHVSYRRTVTSIERIEAAVQDDAVRATLLRPLNWLLETMQALHLETGDLTHARMHPQTWRRINDLCRLMLGSDYTPDAPAQSGVSSEWRHRQGIPPVQVVMSGGFPDGLIAFGLGADNALILADIDRRKIMRRRNSAGGASDSGILPGITHVAI